MQDINNKLKNDSKASVNGRVSFPSPIKDEHVSSSFDAHFKSNT
jgi:hypothetical protein